jgi:hypothetical protein
MNACTDQLVEPGGGAGGMVARQTASEENVAASNHKPKKGATRPFAQRNFSKPAFGRINKIRPNTSQCLESLYNGSIQKFKNRAS